MYDFIIIGGGIVGLSTSMALYDKYPLAKVLLIEKEEELAMHQTGHNSGVIHSGIYYKPGSFKARFAKAGSHSMTEFCKKHKIDHDICGKIIVATKKEEIPLLHALYKRSIENNLETRLIDKGELREIEPYVNGLAAIQVPAAGIVNYKQVSLKFAELVNESGCEISLNTEVEKVHESKDEVLVETSKGPFKAKYMINCAGLHSDRVAKLSGYHTDVKIIPFRGEYYKLKPEKRHLVKNLIYPVPNPNFPFLGVHFTRMINGEIEAGPNAVLGFKREGYKKTDFSMKDFAEVMGNKGFWKLASKYVNEGASEMKRSLSKASFTRSLQELIPDIKASDLLNAPAGVRAQALRNDGTLVDDFYVINGKRSIHVCNAPSPAATASIEIGKSILSNLHAEDMENKSVHYLIN
ncbi:L-2-hydroxyglutarate oxidase [Alkalihalophilus sp. As8PL]|uniref:L-2-hydroxyglutarate oxidase n=1 Tax=Alkalihalophilus sp. As8PL TaxID=3237103 RepID=A0AB39BW89_9BACI